MTLDEALNTLMSEVDPETPEEIDEVIRAAGYDPDEVAERMRSLAERLIAEHKTVLKYCIQEMK